MILHWEEHLSADVVQGRQPCALDCAPALVSSALVDRHLDHHLDRHLDHNLDHHQGCKEDRQLDHHLDHHQEGYKEYRQQDDQPDYHLDHFNHCRCCAEKAALCTRMCSSHGDPCPYTVVMCMAMMVKLVTMLTMMMMTRLLVMVVILRSSEGSPVH